MTVSAWRWLCGWPYAALALRRYWLEASVAMTEYGLVGATVPELRIIDLAGFPKDVYYMYKSEWTDDTVLHVFPHWNWEPGREVDVWAYYSIADVLTNGVSVGAGANFAWTNVVADGTIHATFAAGLSVPHDNRDV